MTVVMVNGRHAQNIPGRKTDMVDCQWLATLHAHGLLRAGFVPEAEICRLQDCVRLRADRISLAASHAQHRQKALDRMNIRAHEVINSLTGVSGLSMVRARSRLRAALHGAWREEYLFALSQALCGWDFYQA